LVEQRIENPRVGGSIPPQATSVYAPRQPIRAPGRFYNWLRISTIPILRQRETMAAIHHLVNWDRCVFLTGIMGDELINRLAPDILKFRQATSDPITVAINSAGGSVAAVETLYALLRGPSQHGIRCTSIAVVTNRAYSAAATFLALANYAVALPHASILFHDVRYGEMEDVTPNKASLAARQLANANEALALKLADPVFRRLTWLYIDMRSKFQDELDKDATYKKFKSAFDTCGVKPDDEILLDLAALATTMHDHLSDNNKIIVVEAVRELHNWAATVGLSKSFPKFKIGRQVGLLDGAKGLYKLFSKDVSGLDVASDDLHLLITILVAELATSKRTVGQSLDEMVTEYRVMESINDPRHIETATSLVLRSNHAFLAVKGAEIMQGDNAAAKEDLTRRLTPFVQVMWYFCFLLCRKMLNGEHVMTPRDALMLGIVDEVAGDSLIQSKRAFAEEREAAAAAPAAKA
jgi:ATP-dependent protease ClpP protease subunit